MKKSLICLAVTENTLRDAVRTVNENREYIDCVELRADFLEPGEISQCAKFPGLVNIPAILTIRTPRDGGRFTGTEADRVLLLRKALSGRYAYVDLEYDLRATGLDADAEKSGARIIRSFHDFNGVPEKLLQKLNSMACSERELPKAAVMPKSSKELFDLLCVMNESKNKEKILLGMGRFGFPTRVLAQKLGSFLTYCSMPGKLAAPGHIDPKTLAGLYGFRSQNDSTKIFGIIGFPLEHSLSPQIHNPGFHALGIDAVYLQFPTDDVDVFFNIFELLGIEGISVTIPHKEKVMSHCDVLDKTVKEAGACNTIVRRNGGLFGTNTDIDGFISPLKRLLGGAIPKGLKATVIGTGGAGKACIYGLVREGARVLLLNRTAEKAKALAEHYGCEWGGLSGADLDRMEDFNELIVQTTSAGMEPNTDEDPIAGYAFKGTEIAYDIVYKPLVTKFLTRARDAGCRIVKGSEMLLDQASVQFELFTGKKYPEELKSGMSFF